MTFNSKPLDGACPRGARALVRANARRLAIASLLYLAAALGWSPGARAEAVYWTRITVLKSFFATSARVTYKQVTLDAADRAAIAKQLGYAPPPEQTIYYGLDAAGHVTGYAMIGQQLGQHEPITFAVLIDPKGRAERVEVMVYREPYGDEVREQRFCRQFTGKTAADPVRPGDDIVAISGASISSRSLAIGVKRALAIVERVMLHGAGHRPAAHASAGDASAGDTVARATGPVAATTPPAEPTQ
ncbi:MAG: FMN-binding protein [Myxococcales bacterium]|nr:FMN-binding protein [Myxococcales bacterium]